MPIINREIKRMAAEQRRETKTMKLSDYTKGMDAKHIDDIREALYIKPGSDPLLTQIGKDSDGDTRYSVEGPQVVLISGTSYTAIEIDGVVSIVE